MAKSVCKEICGEEIKIQEAQYVGKMDIIILVELENHEEKKKNYG